MSRKPTFGHTRTGLAVHARTAHHRGGGVNARIGLAITTAVGSMWCAYAFALLALLSLPAILTQAFSLHVFPHWLINVSLGSLVAWASSYFLQLVLLPIIIVGQNVQAQASDARAAKTFEDTEVVVDRLDVRTEGGIKTVLDAVKVVDGQLGAVKAVADEIHRHVTALAPKAGDFPPPPEPEPAPAPVVRKLRRPAGGDRM